MLKEWDLFLGSQGFWGGTELETLEGWYEMWWPFDILPLGRRWGSLEPTDSLLLSFPQPRGSESWLLVFEEEPGLSPHIILFPCGLQMFRERPKLWVGCCAGSREAKYGSRYGLDVEKGKSHCKRAFL